MSDLKMKLEIDLEQFVSMDDLENNVIRQISDYAIGKMSGGHTKSFHSMCVDAINQAVSGRVQEKVEEIISKPFLPRDQFGQPLPDAKETTLSKMVSDAVQAAMEETVDRDGKPRKRTNWDHAIPRMQWALQQVAGSKIDEEVRKAIKALNEDAKKKVREQVAAAIAMQLTK